MPVAAAIVVTLASISLPAMSGFPAVAVTQSLATAAGTIFALAITGIALGIVGPKAFTARGAVATVQGLGGAFSATLAGVLIVWGGYNLAFLTLAVIAAAGFLVYCFAMPETAERS